MTENICKHQIEIDVRQKIFFTNFVLKWHFLPSEYQTQRTVQIHPKCVWHGCLAFNQRKQFWKKPIKYVFYSFSRNFFYSSWLDYRLLRFYRLFFTKNAAMMLENQFKIFILNIIKIDISETIYLFLFHIIPQRRNDFHKIYSKMKLLDDLIPNPKELKFIPNLTILLLYYCQVVSIR